VSGSLYLFLQKNYKNKKKSSKKKEEDKNKDNKDTKDGTTKKEEEEKTTVKQAIKQDLEGSIKKANVISTELQTSISITDGTNSVTVWKIPMKDGTEREVKEGEQSEGYKLLKEAALKRLQRDLKEISQNPLPTVSAVPLEDNIFEWHANLLGSSSTLFGGLIFHITMIFPYCYPHQPPRVKMEHFIDHPNVFGSYICLDMLEQGQFSSHQEKLVPNTGWTTAYSVQSILVQLQNFLSANAYSDKIARDWGIGRSKSGMEKYVCNKCGHGVVTKKKIYPPIDQKIIDEINKQRGIWEEAEKKKRRKIK